jgi:hypothetical protein
MRRGARFMGAVGLVMGLGSWTTGSAEELNYYLDGQKLYQALSGGGLGEMFALGYVAGVSDTSQVDNLHCAPNSLQVGTLSDVIKMELKNVPEYRTIPATHLVTLAMILHWPCEK